jgi:hypothetical protein
MFSQDYIIRLISQATAALATILGLRKSGQLQQALQVVDQTLEALVGLNASLVKAMDDRSLLGLLTSQGSLDADRLLIIADLFEAEGEILVAQDRGPESVESYARALALYVEVALNDQSSPDAELSAKIEALFQQVSTDKLPLETLSRLRDFYARFLELDDAMPPGNVITPAQAERHLQEIDERLNEA